MIALNSLKSTANHGQIQMEWFILRFQNKTIRAEISSKKFATQQNVLEELLLLAIFLLEHIVFISICRYIRMIIGHLPHYTDG